MTVRPGPPCRPRTRSSVQQAVSRKAATIAAWTAKPTLKLSDTQVSASASAAPAGSSQRQARRAARPGGGGEVAAARDEQEAEGVLGQEVRGAEEVVRRGLPEVEVERAQRHDQAAPGGRPVVEEAAADRLDEEEQQAADDQDADPLDDQADRRELDHEPLRRGHRGT